MRSVKLFCSSLLLPGMLLLAQSAAASFAGVSPDTLGMTIEQIRISGNERTREEYILRWSGLRPGQPLTMAMLKRARQGLRDRGLFRRVQFQSELIAERKLLLHVLLEEKNFTLLVPRLNRNGDGDVKAGIRLRMHNLQGADQTLELLVQQEEESDGDESEQARFRYRLPLLNKPYELSWQLRYKTEDTRVEDFENIETSRLVSMGVARDWNVGGFSIPLTLETAITLEQIDLDRPYPEALEAIEAGQFNRLKLELIYDDVHRERHRRFGRYYSIALERGFDWLESDFESTIVTFEANGFRRLNRFDNVNYRLVLAATNDSPFDYLSYGIGGASNLRGLEDDDERGDSRFFVNLEYIYAYRRNPNLRHTLFVDFGNVYRKLEDIDLSDLEYTVGTGFRWKIQSFVKTDLFLDYGYDIEEKDGRLYGGTSLNF